MKTHEILYQTLAQAQDYVNGEQLAQEMGLSRTSIWKAIQRLEKEGIEIESVKKRGYKILSGDLLIPQVIEEHCPLTVSYNPHSLSTQLDAKNAMVAAAIYKALKNLALLDIDIKWVNDIYYKGKKVGGILTEAISSIETGLITDVIIGIGLNFAITNFPTELKDKAGSLFDSQPPITRNELIAEIWKEFFNSPEEELIYLYKQRSLVLGKEVRFEQNQTSYQGLAKDISDSGQLLVKLTDGQERWLNSGEISLKQWDL